MKHLRAQKRKILTGLILIGVAILLFTTYLFISTDSLLPTGHRSTTDTPNAQAAHTDHDEHVHQEAEQVAVLYTETGFSPSRLEIPVGTTVNFTNLTETPLWVGSDPHPEHTDYSDFDAKQDYRKDETYTYSFTSPGTYGFHNHKKSLHRGVITVVDADAHDHNIDKTPENMRAVRDELIALLDPHDPDTIFDVIDAIQSDDNLALNCHDIAHDIGHRAYELYGFSEAMTFNNPNHVNHPLVQYICAGGYMHGILEELSLSQPEFMLNPDAICEAMPSVERDSCFHGVGHVFMLANERNVSAALEDCRLVGNDTDMYRCFEGIRMEQFWGNTDHVSTTTLGWDQSDPAATCIAAQDDEKPTCFLYAPFGYLREHPKDYFGAVTFCTSSRLSRSDSSFCLKGLGITMMSKFQGQNLEGSEMYVMGLDADLKYAFYQGVLGYAQLSGKSASELANTCARFATDSSLCYAVYASMEPTFAAYDELNAKRDTLKNSQALRLAQDYFSFANQRDLSRVQSMVTENTSFSAVGGVYLGVSQIMEMHRTFFADYTSAYWDVLAIDASQPGIARVEFVFYGTYQDGRTEEQAGVAYVIAQDDSLKHIEIR